MFTLLFICVITPRCNGLYTRQSFSPLPPLIGMERYLDQEEGEKGEGKEIIRIKIVAKVRKQVANDPPSSPVIRSQGWISI